VGSAAGGGKGVSSVFSVFSVSVKTVCRETNSACGRGLTPGRGAEGGPGGTGPGVAREGREWDGGGGGTLAKAANGRVLNAYV
jgi:hypothetical protein